MAFQPRPRWSYECNDIVDDLSADRFAAWAPDVAADVDMQYLAAGISSGEELAVQWLSVPRPGKEAMRVPVLHPAAMVALHRAVAPLRRAADRSLAPGVLAYRRGADRNWRYSQAWRSFSEAAAQLAGRAQWVVFTDVASFFDHAPWSLALRASSILTDEHSTQGLRAVAERLSAAGLPHLPSGYSDARLLGNLILGEAERGLPVAFMRWVDDYRLFAGSEEHASEGLAELSGGLNEFGLSLHPAKTRLVNGPSAVGEMNKTITPIFDAEIDSANVIREKLIGALHRAATDPAERRSELRYALTGLTREREPVFIDWALNALWEIPWEAPRLVAYLASVADDPRVGSAAEQALHQAAELGDPWRVSRLAPLVINTCRGRVRPSTLIALRQSMPHLISTPAWGLALRVISLCGARDLVMGVLTEELPDVRAALTVLRDLDVPLPAKLCAVEPALAEALRYAPAPAPPVRSML